MALIERTAAALRRESIQEDETFVGIGEESMEKRRKSCVSNLVGVDENHTERGEDDAEDDPTAAETPNSNGTPPKKRPSRMRATRHQRMSTTRAKMRSMSALGTKAYAAPEIKNKLRNKTHADIAKTNAALTECVADYGMIVDAYSVGWTLRVILSGVPPNSTISQYMRKYNGKEVAEEVEEVGCCCFGGGSVTQKDARPPFRVRDTDEMPKGATLFISALTKPNPEDRMSIREAQNHPWIKGDERENQYEVPQGDYPSHHGDPVVPLICAGELSRIVEAHHQ
jgi:serine/threonine protein kinase